MGRCISAAIIDPISTCLLLQSAMTPQLVKDIIKNAD